MYLPLVFIISVVIVATVVSEDLKHPRSHYEAAFFDWLSKYPDAKPTNGAEFVKRLNRFAINDDFIHAHNSGSSSFKCGHNRFSAMSSEEFKQYLGIKEKESRKPSSSVHTGLHSMGNDSSVDWTEKGAVTEVKDQGQCGSCWAFSTTGSIEGAFQIKTGSLQAFSEQQFVDCDTIDHACEGGLMDQAFTWAKQNGGVALEKDYKYTAVQGPCETKVRSVEAATPQSYTDVPPYSDESMMSAIQQQPVSIAIDAGRLTFQLYETGVYDDPLCGTRLNHGVLAVGYGTNEMGKDYYKVKNSWGPYWGNHGYILLVRGGDVDNEKGGQCGMLKEGSYPNL